jgi:hypothetical protein
MASFSIENIDCEKTFYMSKEVEIIKIYDVFHLAKIRLLYANFEIVVDLNALSATPDMTKTISLGLIGGNWL